MCVWSCLILVGVGGRLIPSSQVFADVHGELLKVIIYLNLVVNIYIVIP